MSVVMGNVVDSDAEAEADEDGCANVASVVHSGDRPGACAV
jgi:hypothetical protein